MITYFKRNDIGTAFLLVFVCVVLKIKYILSPPAFKEIDDLHIGLVFAFPSWKQFYLQHPSVYVFFSICCLFAFALYLNYVANKEKLFPRKSFLPALSFLVFTSFLPVLHIFSVLFIANMLLFVAFAKTLELPNSAHPQRLCFDIGLYVSLASLFYFPSILLFFLFLALLLFFRPFKLQENIAYLLGIVTPIYFLLSILYLSDSKAVPFLHLTPPIASTHSGKLLLISLVSMVLLVYGLFLTNQNGFKNPIIVRKKWNAVVLYLFFMMLIGVLSRTFPGLPWLLIFAPFSILLSQTFLHNKEKYNTFTFYFLILLILIVQWVQ